MTDLRNEREIFLQRLHELEQTNEDLERTIQSLNGRADRAAEERDRERAISQGLRAQNYQLRFPNVGRTEPAQAQRRLPFTGQREAHPHIIVNRNRRRRNKGSLIDRGANGGCAGDDVRVISIDDDQNTDVTGFYEHQVTNIPVGTVGGVMTVKGGKQVIGIFNQYAITRKGHSIHSCIQLEEFGAKVDDRSSKIGGNQHVVTGSGTAIPIDIIDGLPYIRLRPYTDKEWDELPHVIMTRDMPWDPQKLDSNASEDREWHERDHGVQEDDPETAKFTERGEYRHRISDEEARRLRLQERNRRKDRAERRATVVRIEDVHAIDRNPDLNCYPFGTHDHENYVGAAPDIPWTGSTEEKLRRIDARQAFHQAPLDSTDPVSYGTDDESDLSGTDEDEDDDSVESSDMDFEERASRMTRSIFRANRTITEERYKVLKSCFLYADKETIEKTLENTTQYARTNLAGPMIKEKHRAHYPAANIQRRREAVAMDDIDMKVPAVADGATVLFFMVGRSSHVIDVFGLASKAQSTNAVEDSIRMRGAMEKIITDKADHLTGRRMLDILRAYMIKGWASEPYQHRQNFAERAWRDFKAYMMLIMKTSNAKANEWLLVAQYVAYIQNRMALKSLGWRTPLEVLEGQTPDVSIIYAMTYRTRVYFKAHPDKVTVEKIDERPGFFVGFSEGVGHSGTYKILTEDTTQIIYRSRVRVASDLPNKRADDKTVEVLEEKKRDRARKTPEDPIKDLESSADNPVLEILTENLGEGELKTIEPMKPEREVIRTPEQARLPPADREGDGEEVKRLPTVDLSTLPGRSYLRGFGRGEKLRVEIRDVIEENEKGIRLKLWDEDKDSYERLIPYNQVVNFIEERFSGQNDHEWKFRSILKHRKTDAGYDILIEYEDGQVLWRPHTDVLEDDDKVILADYARRKKLLSRKEFAELRKLAKTTKKISRMIKQAQLRSFRTAVRYKYGVKIPQGVRMALRFDKENADRQWGDAIDYEVGQILSRGVFRDEGKHKAGDKLPEGYKLIRVHFVFDVKHDGARRARLVADGNLTQLPLDAVYSGVVTLRSVRLIAFAAELNGLELWGTDIGSAYLESFTSEKVCIVAGPEFGELAGHLLIIVRALYGLRSSGLCWHKRFAEVLRDMGFFMCHADNDVWMRDKGDHYEYIGVYVDDLEIASKDPEAITKDLQEKYDFALKDCEALKYHLGCDFGRDQDGTFYQSPTKYIDRIADNFARLFGKQPRSYRSPLEKNDHPEIDESPLLEAEDVKKYQSLIGSLQWAVSLGRFDIAAAVCTLSSFRVAPRKGHLERAKRVVGYLVAMKHGRILYRTDRPDLSDLEENGYDWSSTPYGKVEELVPEKYPEPKGKTVDSITYVDANLMHDLMTGRAMTGTMHFANKTLIDFMAKKQNTVETATYGSEINAARIATEQIMDIRTTFRYMGMPVGRSVLLGDNQSVLASTTVPHSKLNKRHTALSYHRVREAVAANIMSFYHVPGEINPADILSKHWGYAQVWPILKAVLFWQGDTMDAFHEDQGNDTSDDRGVKTGGVSSSVSQPVGSHVGATLPEQAREARNPQTKTGSQA